MKLYNSITETIGNTPLIKLNRLSKDCVATVALKMESHNPCLLYTSPSPRD